MMEPDTVELLKDNKGQVISPNKKKTISRREFISMKIFEFKQT